MSQEIRAIIWAIIIIVAVIIGIATIYLLGVGIAYVCGASTEKEPYVHWLFGLLIFPPIPFICMIFHQMYENILEKIKKSDHYKANEKKKLLEELGVK